MGLVYKNRFIINQRGASIDIDNTTEQEKLKLSQRSGSNISMTNVVNSELATNNKQVNVVHDSFETVGNDKLEYVVNNRTIRTGSTTYELKGFSNKTQLDAFQDWKDAYSDIAEINAEFRILRGGKSYPNGTETSQSGSRADNPVIGSSVFSVENKFNGYSGVPVRRSGEDEVSSYVTVPDRGRTVGGTTREIRKEDVEQGAGNLGSKAPGVVEFGPEVSAATEDGTWGENVDSQHIRDLFVSAQPLLNIAEEQMGDGGDEILTIKRHRYEQIGAVFNDFPSIKIDDKGRSQPLEMLVSETGAFKNHDYVPHVEEVDNSSNFPCGNDDKVIGNRMSRVVGSGGIHLKTTGAMELGGSNLKVGFKRANINASHGIQIASESFVEIQSLKSITLRTNRQVYVECALGVRGNLVVGGGAYVEGELYCHHITAPLEVHQTQDTITFGQFSTESPRSMMIGECLIGGAYYPVFAMPTENIIVNYPHSHHHNGIPMRLTKANKDVRNFAARENINAHNNIAQSLPQNHERKLAQVSPDSDETITEES